VLPSGAATITVNFRDGIILALIGITATAGQLLMTQSYKYLPVRVGATLAMLEPVFCYMAGVAIFGELLSVKSVAGTALIIGSCAAMVLYGAEPANSSESGLQSAGG
jgi:drug/metabolite transporter (DMT)-like permease